MLRPARISYAGEGARPEPEAAQAPAPEPPPPVQPVGKGSRVIGDGETLVSIAEETGHFWRTLWNHPDNAELKEARQQPNVLLAGDRLTIPPLREKRMPCDTEQKHRFRRRGVPTKVTFRVQSADGTAFPGKEYVLQVGPHRYTGTTDGDGQIDRFVKPASRTGELTVRLDEEGYPAFVQWTLQIGFLDPGDTVTGVQGRLAGLGYHDGSEWGKPGPRTEEALRRFQRDQGMEPTGAADATTRQKLKAAYGY